MFVRERVAVDCSRCSVCNTSTERLLWVYRPLVETLFLYDSDPVELKMTNYTWHEINVGFFSISRIIFLFVFILTSSYMLCVCSSVTFRNTTKAIGERGQEYIERICGDRGSSPNLNVYALNHPDWWGFWTFTSDILTGSTSVGSHNGSHRHTVQTIWWRCVCVCVMFLLMCASDKRPFWQWFLPVFVLSVGEGVTGSASQYWGQSENNGVMFRRYETGETIWNKEVRFFFFFFS